MTRRVELIRRGETIVRLIQQVDHSRVSIVRAYRVEKYLGLWLGLVRELHVRIQLAHQLLLLRVLIET